MAIKCPECQTENTSDSQFCRKCATPLPPSEGVSVTKTLETPVKKLTKGTTFADRYEILEELGKGGMGEVYKVRDKKLNEEMALKVLKSEIAADKGTIERFKNELKLARKIGHRNVCRMYDLNEEEETPYITMEYVKGEDLKSFIRKKERLEEEEAIAIAKQVCEGLAEAHELGVIHRDLKPSNIMIDQKSNAKVMDFGIARSVEAPGVTHTGVMIGTPDYISPEQAEGEEADQRSDIYSFGVILYEMMTGSVPFKGDTALSVALKHKTKVPADPRKLNPEVSEDLSRLILICMEKDRERRYQKAEEVLSDLRNIEEGLPLGTKIRPRRETFVATLIRKKLFIPALAFIALVIIGVIIWQPWSQKETVPISSDKPSLAILRFKNNTGDEGLDFWRNALSELLIHDLSQSRYIYVLPNNRLLDILSKFNLENSDNYSYENLQKFASWSGFNQVITGEYYRSGDSFRVNITLHDGEKGEIKGTDSAEGKGPESLFGMVDELTRKIKTLVKLPEDKIASDFDLAIGEITTNSPEAYKFFSEGTKLYFKIENLKAIPLLENAVALDPGLTMAYRYLGACHINLGNRVEGEKYYQKAIELAEHVSERERLQIQAGYFIFLEDFGKAFETSEKLVQLYPNDILGNRFMAFAYQYGYGETEKATKYFENAYRNYPENGQDCTHLVHNYTLQGLVKKGGEILEKYLKDFPDVPAVRLRFIENLANQKKYELALKELNRLFQMAPTRYPYPVIKAEIYLLTGQLVKAEQEYKKFLETQGRSDQLKVLYRFSRLYLSQGKLESSKKMIEKMSESARQQGDKIQEFKARIYQAYLHLITGNFSGALNECKEAKKIAIELENIDGIRNALCTEAEAYLGLKSMAEAEKALEELKKSLEEEKNKRAYRVYHWLAGLIELEKENFKQAVENFERAISLSYSFEYAFWPNDYISYLEALAWTHYRTGNLEKARREYEKISSHPRARFFYGDIYAKSFYMLSKIYEQQSDKAKAIENYEKFLELWKDADPGIHEVEDAKKRLAGLMSQ